MGKPWTDSEYETLRDQLSEGVVVSSITGLDSRTLGAIAKKAGQFGYGTKDVNGEIVLYSGIKRRTAITTSSNKEADYIPSIEINAVDVNAKVVEVLQDNNIFINPKIVYDLSILVMEVQGVTK